MIFKTILAATILFLCISCSVFSKNSDSVNLTNTVWNYSDFEKKYDIIFAKNNNLITKDSADTTPGNDNWEQSKGIVNFYFNNKYSTYKGKIFKDSIVGFGKNKDTLWAFKMTKK
jgi:hypothetical protein